jgi:small nuclear ribonucleoprotein (snRNP)-like protein
MLNPEVVRTAAFRAAEILSGMGYTGRYGSIHLMKLNLQANTITAILHQMVAYQISRQDPNWIFHPSGGRTPDLTDVLGHGVQIKATSNTKIKGNMVSSNEGYFVIIKYSKEDYSIKINEILMGEVKGDDWIKRKGTQWAFLKPEAEAKLMKIY